MITCGMKPILNVKWTRGNFWVYGVVEPLNGWHFEQEYAYVISEHFQSFLDALSTALSVDALIQLDQAKAHQALSLRWPENLILVLQPAPSPELNPTERFWSNSNLT